MRKPIKRIIIVGGGSAGWMSAAFLSKQHPNLEIALVESPDIPVIGVGESTLGTINSFLHLLGITDEEFMPYVQGTYKLGIQFSDFYKKDDVYYYPFGLKDLQNTGGGTLDWYVKKTLNPELSHNDFYECFYSCMPLIYKNKIYDNKDGQLPNYSFRQDVAYHMDAISFGQFLREKIAEPNGVVHIQANVDEVFKDAEGYIDGLKLDNGDVLEADLYIDCTGFKSLLLEKSLDVRFESYRDWLPNNKAWTVHVPYTDKEKEMHNVTDCIGYNNGWIWMIPLYNRIGSGYVYSNEFITDEKALEEYKAFLDSDKMRVHNPERSKDLEFKLIEIKNGVHKKCWHKNVVGVGLSYGFIEPLESTGLLSVQEIILRLSEMLYLEQINKVHEDHFNYIVKYIMDNFKSFVAYHYTLSSRRDTEYWRKMTEWVAMDARLEDPKFLELHTTMSEMATRMLQTHDMPGDLSMGGVPDIFVGNRYIPTNKTHLDIFSNFAEVRGGTKPNFFNDQTADYWEQKKEYINSLAEDSLSHYQYLKQHIYKEEDDNKE